jgi:hypothetical protein
MSSARAPRSGGSPASVARWVSQRLKRARAAVARGGQAHARGRWSVAVARRAGTAPHSPGGRASCRARCCVLATGADPALGGSGRRSGGCSVAPPSAGAGSRPDTGRPPLAPGAGASRSARAPPPAGLRATREPRGVGGRAGGSPGGSLAQPSPWGSRLRAEVVGGAGRRLAANSRGVPEQGAAQQP